MDPPSAIGPKKARQEEHPAAICCSRCIAIALVGVAVIGGIAGLFAYLVAAGHLATTSPTLTTLGSIGRPNAYLLLGGSALLLIFSTIVLVCQTSKR